MVLVSNERQSEAICSKDKFTLIDAGPGAGKTRVLIERIKFLLKEEKVSPDSLLVITFTNKATDELRLRLLEDVDISESDVNHMHISTIHSFCKVLVDEYDNVNYNLLADDGDFNERMVMFLRKYRKKLGFVNEAHIMGSELPRVLDLYEEFTIFDIDDNFDDLLKYIKDNYPVSDEYRDFISSLPCDSFGNVYSFPLDEVKDKGFRDDWYNAKLYRIVKSYPKFKNLVKGGNFLDYNFLQIRACELLESGKVEDFPFTNIFVDEYQDIDPIQNRIFDAIVENFSLDSFTVVGDADQSIYGFRGSNPSYFSEFSHKFNSSVYVLDTNYRSRSEIVEFTEDFIGEYRDVDYSKDLKSYRGMGGLVSYITNQPSSLTDDSNFKEGLKECNKSFKTDFKNNCFWGQKL